jgi:ankyrin repeat protein
MADSDQLNAELLAACSKTDTEVAIVEELLNKGADIEAHNGKYKLSPLHTAVKAQNVGVIKVLIQRGANVNAVNSLERTPLHYVEGVEIATLLLNAGANLQAHDIHGETPVHIATSGNRADVVKLFRDSARLPSEASAAQVCNYTHILSYRITL